MNDCSHYCLSFARTCLLCGSSIHGGTNMFIMYQPYLRQHIDATFSRNKFKHRHTKCRPRMMFFWNRLFWCFSTIIRWRRRFEEMLSNNINQSFITEEVQKCIVGFRVCLTGGLKSYNYIWKLIKKMEINSNIFK